jgi:hypothetical protein
MIFTGFVNGPPSAKRINTDGRMVEVGMVEKKRCLHTFMYLPRQCYISNLKKKRSTTKGTKEHKGKD